MALINISADMKATNLLLARIATVLERICTRGMGIPLADLPPAKQGKQVIPDELSYTDDQSEVKRELEKAAGLHPDEDEVEAEDV